MHNQKSSGSRVIVNSDSLAPEAVQLLVQRDATIRYIPTMATTDALRDAAAEAPTHAIISRAAPITAEVMDASPELRVISKHGVGYDNVDLEAAFARGITVMRTYGANSRSVSELVLTLTLNLLKHVFQLDASLRAGRWDRSHSVSYTHLRAHETGRNLVCRLLL